MPASSTSFLPVRRKPTPVNMFSGSPPIDRGHHLLLVDRGQHGAANARIAGGRGNLVGPQETDLAVGVQHADLYAACLLQLRQQIGQRNLDPVHLAGHQRIRRGGAVGDHLPLDAIDQHAMAAGGVARRFVARHVAVELRERGVAAQHVLVRQPAERAAADRLGDLLERIGQSPAAPASSPPG